MQDMPHIYKVTADSIPEGVMLSASGIPDLCSSAPAEFGGPGDQWSPETLLTGAVADCFILSFKAIARASRFEWIEIKCEVEAVLDRVARRTLFTEIRVNPSLKISDPEQIGKAEKLLRKAEAACLITNSLTAEINMSIDILVSGE
ncbi:MAG: OsmC family protein [Pseudomonadales bacterium]|nr:OsmC family protein [Pseudomonadales bacterium]